MTVDRASYLIGPVLAMALLHQRRMAPSPEAPKEPTPDPTLRRPGESRQAWRARLRSQAKGRS